MIQSIRDYIINPEELSTIKQFIEDTKNGIPRDKMILLQGPNKHFILNIIIKYVGEDKCMKLDCHSKYTESDSESEDTEPEDTYGVDCHSKIYRIRR